MSFEKTQSPLRTSREVENELNICTFFYIFFNAKILKSLKQSFWFSQNDHL